MFQWLMKERDTQREAVYAAQANCKFITNVYLDGIERVQQYLDCILRKPWFIHLYGRMRISVRPVKKKKFYTKNKIYISDGNMHIADILHILSHVICLRWRGIEEHGPEFCKTYLELVYLLMGAMDYMALCKSFQNEGVCFLIGPADKTFWKYYFGG